MNALDTLKEALSRQGEIASGYSVEYRRGNQPGYYVYHFAKLPDGHFLAKRVDQARLALVDFFEEKAAFGWIDPAPPAPAAAPAAGTDSDGEIDTPGASSTEPEVDKMNELLRTCPPALEMGWKIVPGNRAEHELGYYIQYGGGKVSLGISPQVAFRTLLSILNNDKTLPEVYGHLTTQLEGWLTVRRAASRIRDDAMRKLNEQFKELALEEQGWHLTYQQETYRLFRYEVGSVKWVDLGKPEAALDALTAFIRTLPAVPPVAAVPTAAGMANAALPAADAAGVPDAPPAPAFQAGDNVLLDGKTPGVVRVPDKAGKVGIFTISASGKGSTHYYAPNRLTRSDTASADEDADEDADAPGKNAIHSVTLPDDENREKDGAALEARGYVKIDEGEYAAPDFIEEAITFNRQIKAYRENAGRIVQTHVPHWVQDAAWHRRYKEVCLHHVQAVIIARIGAACVIVKPCFEFVAGLNVAHYEKTPLGEAVCWWGWSEATAFMIAASTKRDVMWYAEIGGDAAAFVEAYFPAPDRHAQDPAAVALPVPASVDTASAALPAAAAPLVPDADAEPVSDVPPLVPAAMAWVFEEDADEDAEAVPEASATASAAPVPAADNEPVPAAGVTGDALEAEDTPLSEIDDPAVEGSAGYFAARHAAWQADADRARALTEARIAAAGRRCRTCGQPIPANARADAKYCGDICRKRAHRLKDDLKSRVYDVAREIRALGRYTTNDDVFEIVRAGLVEIAAAADEVTAQFDLDRPPLME